MDSVPSCPPAKGLAPRVVLMAAAMDLWEAGPIRRSEGRQDLEGDYGTLVPCCLFFLPGLCASSLWLLLTLLTLSFPEAWFDGAS